jgi:hypothetical protein
MYKKKFVNVLQQQISGGFFPYILVLAMFNYLCNIFILVGLIIANFQKACTG